MDPNLDSFLPPRLAGLLPALRAVRDHEAVRLLLAGVTIGAVAGVAAGAFDFVMLRIGDLVLGTGEPALDAPTALRALLGPALCGVLAGFVIRDATRRKRPQGVPDVIACVQGDEHPLSMRDASASAVAAALTVGGGQSGGREGPIIQLAATIAAKVCKWFGLRSSRVRPLVAAGAAAGIAASFNSPLGGAFFALEIILGNFAVETFAPVVAATVTGTVVGQALLGNRIAVRLPPFHLRHPAELLLYLVLGVLCAGVAAVFKHAVSGLGARLAASPLPAVARPGIAGLVVGGMAVLGLHPVMGNGYSYMEALLAGRTRHDVLFLVVLLGAKVLATSVTAGGRTGAGLFAPSLFVGAITGSLVGGIVQFVSPGYAEAAGAYGMVGMGAVAAAVMHAPITMTLMLFEMTGNYAVILPLLLALAAAGAASLVLGTRSIYDMELDHLGIAPPRNREELVMYRLTVRDVMRDRAVERVHRDASLAELVERFLSRRVDEVFVVDDAGRLVRVVDIQDVKALLGAPTAGLTAGDVQTRDVPTLRRDTPLATALPRFFDAAVEQLPVLDDDGVLVGVLGERDVVAAYNREVLRTDARLVRIESTAGDERQTDFMELPPGQVLDVIDVGPAMVGHTLRELALPQRHRCTVVAMSVWDEAAGEHRRCAADLDAPLQANDRLVLLGPSEAVAALAGEGR